MAQYPGWHLHWLCTHCVGPRQELQAKYLHVPSVWPSQKPALLDTLAAVWDIASFESALPGTLPSFKGLSKSATGVNSGRWLCFCALRCNHEASQLSLPSPLPGPWHSESTAKALCDSKSALPRLARAQAQKAQKAQSASHIVCVNRWTLEMPRKQELPGSHCEIAGMTWDDYKQLHFSPMACVLYSTHAWGPITRMNGNQSKLSNSGLPRFFFSL